MSSPPAHQSSSTPDGPWPGRFSGAASTLLKSRYRGWALLAAICLLASLFALGVGVVQMLAASRAPFIRTHVLAAVNSVHTVSSTYQPLPGCTPTPHSAGCFPDIVPAAYSQVDYPLQMAVDSGEQVKLLLTTQADQLLLGPANGFGTTTVGAPLNLPTDIENYQDIGVSVDTVSAGESPLVWQLIDAPRKSLLSVSGQNIATRYRGEVTFTWQVRALAAGQNLTSLEFTLYRMPRGGGVTAGPTQMTSAPVPIVAVQHDAAAAGLPYVLVAGGGAGTGLLLVLGLLAQLKGANEAWEGLRFIGSVGKHAYEGIQYVREHKTVRHLREGISRLAANLKAGARTSIGAAAAPNTPRSAAPPATQPDSTHSSPAVPAPLTPEPQEDAPQVSPGQIAGDESEDSH